ncbi:MAG: response regulator [Ramlibacter sp.]|jgi:CheY-like chemotaxis protein
MKDLAPILIVDDSDDDVELFRLGLSELHLANPVEVCRDGVEALDYLMRRGAWAQRTGPQPLFMLLDIKMPRMNGIELLAEIRKQPSLQMLPVVMMTSSNQPRDVAAGYAAGANGFVVKPVGFEKLVESAKAIGTFWGIFNRPAASDAAFP